MKRIQEINKAEESIIEVKIEREEALKKRKEILSLMKPKQIISPRFKDPNQRGY